MKIDHHRLGRRLGFVRAAVSLACVGLLVVPVVGIAGSTDKEAFHTQLEESRPADESVVEENPSEIWLRFSTAVQHGLSTIELVGPDGRPVSLDTVATVAGSEEMQLQASLGSTRLRSGTYTVNWTTAGPDSHIIEGSFAFTADLPPEPQVEADTAATAGVEAPTTSGTTESEDSSGADAAQVGGSGELAEATAPLGLVSRWLGFLGSVLLIGIGAFHFAVVGGAKKRGEAEAVAAFLPRLRGYTYVVASVALLATVLRLADGFVSFGGSRMGTLMFGSPWGLAWWIYFLGAVAAFIGVRTTGRAGTRRGGWRLVALGGVLTAISMPFAGHGWAAASRAISVPAHMLHTLGAGIWLGGLAVLALVALPFLATRKDAEGRSAEAPAWVASFSRIALIGVGVLVVTGGVNAWQHVGGFGSLFGTPYGRTLLVKTGVIGAAFLIGLYNWKQARPALDETGRPGLIKLPATVELILGIGVLLVTAVLVAMHLPA